MKKTLILIIVFLLFFSGVVFAQTEKPRFTLCPQSYVAGEETLYLEGTALPGKEVIISLQKGEEEIKRWESLSNEKGEWSLFTRELINPGEYYLLVKERGGEVGFSDNCSLEISLSGFGLGSYLVSFRNLVSVLSLVLLLIFIIALYSWGRIWQTKRILRKETREARSVLLSSFENLNKEIEEQIRLFDFQPGFSAREREIYEELKKSSIAARDSIEKEIKDIEELL